MNRYLKSVITSIVFFSLFIASSAQASHTGSLVVERIQIATSGTMYLRPAGLGPWGGNDCPNATYAYIGKGTVDLAAYEHVMNLALASKLNGTPIYFQGTCDAGGAYFLINYVILL